MTGKPLEICKSATRTAGSVLIVEDDPAVATSLVWLLQNEGFATSVAGDAPSGLAAYERDRPDCVLLDVAQPKRDGWRVLRAIREHDASTPIIALTSSSSTAAALDCGADDFVTNPYDARDLAFRVRNRVRLRRAELALRESEARFRELFDEAPVGYHEIDLEGRITRVNRTELRMLGYDEAEMLGHTYWEFVQNADTVPTELPARLRANGWGQAIERIYRRKDQSPLPVLVEVRPLRATDGAVTGARVTLQDVTHLKRAEAALRASEEQYRRIVEAAHEGILVGDANDQVTYANPVLTRLLGYPNEELVGRPLATLVTADSAETAALLTERCHQDIGGQYDLRLRRRDYPPLWTCFEVAPLTDSHGDYAGLSATVTDVTERKQAEEARRESEERFAKVFHASPLPIAINRLSDGRFVDVNESYARLLGYERVELLGRTTVELGLWQSAAERTQAIERLRATGSVRELEQPFRAKDGESRYAIASLELVELSGEPCILAFLWDVTERRRLEGQLRQAQKMEAVGRLAGGIAHDFNNLLTVILGHSELLIARNPDNEPLRDALAEVAGAGHRAAALTRQLLAFSRKQILAPRVVSLNTIVANVEKLLRRLLGEDVMVVTSLHPALWLARVDPTQIEQVLINLAVNARDAMPQGGRLTIGTQTVELDGPVGDELIQVVPGTYVRLSVSDTGAGIDEETLPHIFEPFFTTKELGRGTGLGLATVYGIVKQSDGYIWVRSAPGAGTTFEVDLPAHRSTVVDSAGEPARESLRAGTETILLVEDDPHILGLLRQILQLSGYTVLEASNGPTALELAARQTGPFHLLLADVVMPEMSGRELYERLQATRPGLRVLYVSGYTDDVLLRHGVESAAVGLLPKPFAPELLTRKIREVLDTPPPTG